MSFRAYDEAKGLFVIFHSGCLLLYSLLSYQSLFDCIVPPFVPIIGPSTLQSDIISLIPIPLLLFYTLLPPLYYYPYATLIPVVSAYSSSMAYREDLRFPHPPSLLSTVVGQISSFSVRVRLVLFSQSAWRESPVLV